MDDLISRQAAIDAVKEYFTFSPREGRQCAKAIERVPAAEPGRKKGKWIDYSDEGFVECPFCHSATNCEGNKDELHYCFSCGAELR